jgi:trimeric autotransporter adhesin
MATINGGAGNDVLNGTGADDVINGLGGNDNLADAAGNDKLDGGTGNDTLASGIGADTLIGGAGNDKLDGGADNDSLNGAAGNDTLDGGAGQDAMTGGTGNDVYIFDTIGDTVSEAANGGKDEIQTPIDGLSLDGVANIENLTLLGAAIAGSGNEMANTLIGNAVGNKLAGREGNDILEGRGGLDTLTGGLGDDTYIIDDVFDVVEEGAGQGKDTVLTFGDFGLADGVAVEVITVAGTADVEVDGNELANIINGNSGKNELDGADGNDTINGAGGNDRIFGDDGNDSLFGGDGDDAFDGGTGNDTLTGGNGDDGLDGGTGNDVMTGGKGDDRYFVDSAGDKITEAANGGFDVVFADVANFTLGVNVEAVQLKDAGLNATGNGLDNIIAGSILDNKLDGGAGNDQLSGDLGKDTLIGGTGNDTYGLTAAGDLDEDIVIELANGGSDTIATDVDDVSLAAFSNVENLTLLDDEDIDGTGNDGANRLTGNSGKNTLTGGKGDDTLDGGANGDTLKGELGNDTYFIDSLTDAVIEAAGGGKDTVFASLSYLIGANEEVEVLTLTGTGDFNLVGNKFANTINGNTGSNILNGGAGNDTLSGGDGTDSLDGEAGDDVMTGGKGNDIYFVDSVADKINEAANQGTEQVFSFAASFTLGANVENLTLGAGGTGIGNALGNQIIGDDLDNTLDGAAGNDLLAGGGGGDTLLGGAGDDTLNGGSGKDSMTGGIGNDVYIVTDAGDSVIEGANAGKDEIQTNVDSFSLAALGNVENLTLLASANFSATGNDLANVMKGNSGDNKLDGGKGNDTLDGGAGKDTLIGGLGNDTFIVDNAADIAQEIASQGKDIVQASVSYTLAPAQEMEILTLTGASNVDGTGNELANTINGNSGENILKGGGGNDTLNGGDGNDTFDGEIGNDAMAGGKGNDFYTVDSAGDKVTEAANQGIDELFSSLASFTLVANVENLELIGTGLNATGNTLSNRLTGNLADNKLDGGGGNDFLIGRDGKDALIGGAGNDTLSGGSDDDTMTGGTGNDIYFVEDAGDQTIEAAGGGVDEVRAFIDNLTLAANVENLTLEGVATFVGQGNSLANVLIGNSNTNLLFGGTGNDTLDGGTGKDEMFGDQGNDTFIVDNAGDVVNELTDAGKDTVKSSVDFTIKDSQEIETLILSGGASNGVGNNFANIINFAGDTNNFLTLLGNGGNDVLIGASGNDKLDGGEGNDTLDAGNGGIGEDELFGGAGNDSLNGGNGNDLLDGGTGNDIMAGGNDDDTYIAEQVGDKITEAANQGRDRVESSLASFTLGANVEDLFLFGTGVNGIGNTLNNELRGNALANKLDGGSGNDLLAARDGADSLFGGTGNDELLGDGDADILKGGAGNDTLDGGTGADIMFGEAGNDIYRYAVEGGSELPDLGGDTITGFQTGADKIDLSDLLDEFGIDPNAAFSGGFVLLTKSGADTLVRFDSDGAGIFGALPLTLATVVNTTVVQTDMLVA